MERLIITGGRPLNGRVIISGSKNATLPILAASLLTNRAVVLRNVPAISDVDHALALLQMIGTQIERKDNLILRSERIVDANILGDKVGKIRASILLFGALLARNGYAKMNLPGGCAIGARPIDFHIYTMREMGATVTVENGILVAHAYNGLHGAELFFPNVSVGATENAMLLASLADGESVIHNVSMEPEVLELADFLRKLGAEISICESCIMRVRSIPSNIYNTPIEHSISGDRIEAGTYAMAVAATGGMLELRGINDRHSSAWIDVLSAMGVRIVAENDSICVSRDGPLHPTNVITSPYPYFPSDLQAPLAALALQAQGISVIQETLYENRMLYVVALKAMGGCIEVVDHKAIICGGSKLYGASVKATDLRAAAALIIAALASEGTSNLSSMHYVARGYQGIKDKLIMCGANIV